MKERARDALACAILVMGCIVGCSDNAATECDAATYVNACHKDLKSVYVCQDGEVTEKACSFGCDTATGACKNADGTVSICTEASYPAACKDASTRTYCKDGLKATESCADGMTCIEGDCRVAESCTEASYPSACKDASTRTYCKDGLKATESCSDGCLDGVCQASGDERECTEALYPSACRDASTRIYCKDGVKAEETCANGCQLGQCLASSDSCDASFVEQCETPVVRLYCNNGKIERERCKSGTYCNDALKKKECKTPVGGEKCDPDAFAEFCYGTTTARICDPETKLVSDVNCVKSYGSGYQCDIKENFYGAHKNAVICYSDEDNCDGDPEGTESFEYCYKDGEDGFRTFYRETYVCTQFNTGKHRYFASIEACPNKGKCEQSEIRHECVD